MVVVVYNTVSYRSVGSIIPYMVFAIAPVDPNVMRGIVSGYALSIWDHPVKLTALVTTGT